MVRGDFVRFSKSFESFRRTLHRFACLATPEMGSFPNLLNQPRRGDVAFEQLPGDIEIGSFLNSHVLAELELDSGGVNEDRVILKFLIFTSPDLLRLQLAEGCRGAAMGGLVHFPVAVDAVEPGGEFVVEDGVGVIFEGSLTLDFGFEQEAAADIPGGVEDEGEVVVLGDAGGFEFGGEFGLELGEGILLIGADEDGGGGETGFS